MLRIIFKLFFLFLFFSNLFAANTVPPIVDINSSTRTSIVILDPAHGGGDWGVNYQGIYEKDITLKISKLIKKKIENSNQNISVFLTREGDEYKSNDDRVVFANNKKADIFVSIHCDFILNPLASGYKVYSMAGTEIAGKKDAFELIKWNNVQKYHIINSLKLAGFLHQYMQARLISEDSTLTGNENDDVLPWASRGTDVVFLAPLTGLDMPAALIEICNLNNNNDIEYLKNSQYVNSLAYHIKEGIINFLNFKKQESENINAQ